MLTFTPATGVAQTVSVTLTVTKAAFTISPNSLTVNLVQNAGQYTQPVQVSSSQGPIGFTVGSNASWLTPSITAGSTSMGSVNAIVNDTGLIGANYQGMLTFTPATGSAQILTVTLTITPSGQIGVSPNQLTLNANYQGAAPASQTVSVTSTGSATNFSVTSDSGWLISPSTGTTPQQVSVTAYPGGMVPGTYNGTLTFASGNFSAKVAVSLKIAEMGFSPCDVNQDGLLTVLDIQQLINQALGVSAAANDLNHDAVVSAVDIQIDLNAVLGLGCSAQ